LPLAEKKMYETLMVLLEFYWKEIAFGAELQQLILQHKIIFNDFELQPLLDFLHTSPNAQNSCIEEIILRKCHEMVYESEQLFLETILKCVCQKFIKYDCDSINDGFEYNVSINF
jgi:hypothetical protein